MRRGARFGALTLALCLGAEAGQAARTTGEEAGRRIGPSVSLHAASRRAPVFVAPGAGLLGPSLASEPRPAAAPISVDLLGVVAVGPPLASGRKPEAPQPRDARTPEVAGDDEASPPPREVLCSALGAEDCYAASWPDRLAAVAPDVPKNAWLAAAPFALLSVGAFGWGLAQLMRRAG